MTTGDGVCLSAQSAPSETAAVAWRPVPHVDRIVPVCSVLPARGVASHRIVPVCSVLPAGSRALLLTAFSRCLWESRGPGQPPVPGAEPSERSQRRQPGPPAGAPAAPFLLVKRQGSPSVVSHPSLPDYGLVFKPLWLLLGDSLSRWAHLCLCLLPAYVTRLALLLPDLCRHFISYMS